MESRPIEELIDNGMLWLINRVVFHPRGLALTLHTEVGSGETRWSFQGDGTEPWSFTEADDKERFLRARETLDAAIKENS